MGTARVKVTRPGKARFIIQLDFSNAEERNKLWKECANKVIEGGDAVEVLAKYLERINDDDEIQPR